jgi:hypothetical protein
MSKEFSEVVIAKSFVKDQENWSGKEKQNLLSEGKIRW